MEERLISGVGGDPLRLWCLQIGISFTVTNISPFWQDSFERNDIIPFVYLA